MRTAKDGLPSSFGQGIAADHIQLDPSYYHCPLHHYWNFD